jgi:hypothetical protein
MVINELTTGTCCPPTPTKLARFERKRQRRAANLAQVRLIEKQYVQSQFDAVDGRGNVYVSDGHAIRKISAEGGVTTIAGRVGEWGDTGGAGATARFNNPQGLAADAAGNVCVADRDDQAIRKITPGGVISTLVGSASSSGRRDYIFDFPDG